MADGTSSSFVELADDQVQYMKSFRNLVNPDARQELATQEIAQNEEHSEQGLDEVNTRLDSPYHSSSSLFKNEFSFKTHMKKWVCKVNISSKGAVIVLLWSLILNSFKLHYTIQQYVNTTTSNVFNLLAQAVLIFILLLFPLAGFIGEVIWTRFKILVLASIVIILGIVVYIIPRAITGELVDDRLFTELPIPAYVVYVLSILVYLIGQAFFDANAIQLGVDQLQFNSSVDIIKFIHWYYWTSIALYTTGSYANCSTNNAELIVISMGVVVSLAGLITIVCLHRYFASDVTVHVNPIKLIAQVLNFACRHKQPLRRSALTYGEAPPKRIDLAKTRYGGSFTTEQVEEVKTFWRILVVLLSLFGLSIVELNNPQTYQYLSENFSINLRCFLSYGSIINIIPLIGIPLYHLLLRPFINLNFSMLKRLGFGLFFLLMAQILISIFHTTLYYTHAQENMSCPILNESLNEEVTMVTNVINVNLLFLQQLLLGAGTVLVFMTALEFILAQAPRQMQGLLIGLWYAYQSVGVSVNAVHSYILEPTGCHYATSFVRGGLIFTSFVTYLWVAKAYKYRQRNEISDINERQIIEMYTERQLNVLYELNKNKQKSWYHVKVSTMK